MNFSRLFLASPVPVCEGESLILRGIDPSQARRIDPGGGGYFTSAAGAAALPAGCYFFTQVRGEAGPGQAAITELAMELQKEGLWIRLELEDRVYIRTLQEDGAQVTQLLRPLRPDFL